MPSIQKRGKNSYLLVVEAGYDAKGKRIRKTRTIRVKEKMTAKQTKEYLNTELTKFKIEVEAGEYIAPEKTRIADFVHDWREKYAKKELAESTLDSYENHLRNHIIPALGHLRLEQIKPIQIVDFLDGVQKPGARKDGSEKPLESGTIEVIYRTLRNVLSRAEDWQLIKENPMKHVKKPKVEYKEMSYYDANEAEKAIAALYKEGRMWRLFCLCAMIGGLRRGEILALEWKDVDYEQRTIFVDESNSFARKDQAYIRRPKSKASIAPVEMPQWFMDELKKWQSDWRIEKMQVIDEWEGGDREFVFHSGYGSQIYYTYPSEWWKRFCKRHNLRYIRFHNLRHSAATLLLEEEVDMKVIQKRLRHKSYQTTADTYSHVTRKLSEKATSKLDKFDPRKSKMN